MTISHVISASRGGVASSVSVDKSNSGTYAIVTTAFSFDAPITYCQITGVSATVQIGMFNIVGVVATAAVGTPIATIATPNYHVLPPSRAGIPSFTFAGTNNDLTQVLVNPVVFDGVSAQNASPNLTGVSSTSAVGSPGIQQDASITLTGVATTSAMGTPIHEVDHAVTGVAATSAIGTPTVRGDASITLTGVSASSATDDPTVEIDDAALIGQAAVASVGTVVAEIDHAVTGVASTSAAGDPSVDIFFPVFVTGVYATPLVGLLLGTAVPIIGVETTSAIGSLSVDIIDGAILDGVSSTVTLGTLALQEDNNPSIVGVQTSVALGIQRSAVEPEFDGVEATGEVGDPIPTNMQLPGTAILVQLGTLGVSADNAVLVGVQSRAQAGVPIARSTGNAVNVAIIGVVATFETDMGYDVTLVEFFGGDIVSNVAFGNVAPFDNLLLSWWVCNPGSSLPFTNLGIAAHPYLFLEVSSSKHIIVELFHEVMAFQETLYNATFAAPTNVRWNVILSVNCTTQTVQVYCNDVPLTPVSGGWLVNDLMAGASDVQILSARTGSTIPYGAMADLWMAFPDDFFDLSIESNRRKFINADLTPVYLGSRGAEPLGTSPPLYLTVPAGGLPNDFRKNLGTVADTFRLGNPPPTLLFQAAGTCSAPDSVDGSIIPQTSITLTGVEADFAIGDVAVGTTVSSGLMLTDVQIETVLDLRDDFSVTLRWSDTDGYSWSDSAIRSIGQTGNYLCNPQWRRLGMSRRGRVFEISWSCPQATSLQGATVMLEDASS